MNTTLALAVVCVIVFGGLLIFCCLLLDIMRRIERPSSGDEWWKHWDRGQNVTPSKKAANDD